MAEGNWYPKREARQFEPPPWERDQFEALQRQRREPVPAEPVADAAGVTVAATEAAGPPGVQPEPPARQEPEAARERSAVPAEVDAQAEAMLVQLQAEEPRLDESVKVISLFASGIVLFLGVSIFGWGFVASMRAWGNAMAMAASMFLLVVGLGLAALGYWLGLRATKRQGE
jgi:hypothetical protein